jgi:hypothetical protein
LDAVGNMTAESNAQRRPYRNCSASTGEGCGAPEKVMVGPSDGH